MIFGTIFNLPELGDPSVEVSNFLVYGIDLVEEPFLLSLPGVPMTGEDLDHSSVGFRVPICFLTRTRMRHFTEVGSLVHFILCVRVHDLRVHHHKNEGEVPEGIEERVRD